MHVSLDVLRFTQQARLRSAPLANAAAPALGREAWLEALRQRNAALDWLFYDVGVVSPDEAADLSPWLAAEGAILHVPPSGQGRIEVCASVDEVVDRHAGSLRAFAVAGVGSSALGAAAFARNVADALGEPVAAVVSGYGLADLATEALGGFFLFGATNALRHAFEGLDRWRETGLVSDPSTASSGLASGSPIGRSKDTRTVQALLAHGSLAWRWLVGHSKGNLVISEALYGLRDTAPSRLQALGRQLRVVTVSAKIAMPHECLDIVDVMGQLDGFGALNSRWDLDTEVTVPGAWHHTNTELPMHLPVTKTMQPLLR